MVPDSPPITAPVSSITPPTIIIAGLLPVDRGVGAGVIGGAKAMTCTPTGAAACADASDGAATGEDTAVGVLTGAMGALNIGADMAIPVSEALGPFCATRGEARSTAAKAALKILVLDMRTPPGFGICCVPNE